MDFSTERSTTTLTRSDLALFDGLQIGSHTLQAARIHRVSNTAAIASGFNGQGDLSGLVFPYTDLYGNPTSTARLLRDQLDFGITGNCSAEYVRRPGCGAEWYFPPHTLQSYDCAKTLVVLPVEPLALALSQVFARSDSSAIACAYYNFGQHTWSDLAALADGKGVILCTSTSVADHARGKEWETLKDKCPYVIVTDSPTLTNTDAFKKTLSAGDDAVLRVLDEAVHENVSTTLEVIPQSALCTAKMDEKVKSVTEVTEPEAYHDASRFRALLFALEALFAKYLHLPTDGAFVLALFALNTWVFGWFDTTPYLMLASATRGCGKTTALNCLEAVCCRPRSLVGITAAVLFRIVERDRPTLLIDEAESLDGPSESSQMIAAVANSGYKKGAVVPRASGDKFDVQEFHTYCPKVSAAIGGLTGPLMDRCISLRLEKPPVGVRLATPRTHILRRTSETLRKQCEDYAVVCAPVLQKLYEQEPDEGYWPSMTGRNLEIWTAMLMNARLLGADIESRALSAAHSFTSRKKEFQAEEGPVSLGIELYTVLKGKEGATFFPFEIVTQLASLPAWALEFDRTLNDRARAAKIGRFVARFGVPGTHTRSGKLYPLAETLAKLAAHLPIPESTNSKE